MIINPLFGPAVFTPVMEYNFPHRAAGAGVLESRGGGYRLVTNAALALTQEGGARTFTSTPWGSLNCASPSWGTINSVESDEPVLPFLRE